jgi:hypothetical protein
MERLFESFVRPYIGGTGTISYTSSHRTPTHTSYHISPLFRTVTHSHIVHLPFITIRLRGRNNYLKSKKGSSVASNANTNTNTKTEPILEPTLPTKNDKEFPEPDLESDSQFLESSSLDMLVVSDNFNTDIPYLEAVLEPFQESRGENGSRSPFDFLSASSPFPNIGPGVSCSSTYNSACNYNTNKKTDLNTEMRGRRSRWSNIECETAATKRPPFPIIKKPKNTSIAKVRLDHTDAMIAVMFITLCSSAN